MTDPFGIASVDLFAGLDERERAAVAALGRVRTARRGSTLFRVGSTADAILVVREGHVDLMMPLVVHGEPKEVRFERLGPGDSFAWSALVPPYGAAMVARVAEDCVLLAFRRDALLQLMAAQPRIGFAVTANLARSLGERLALAHALWARQVQRDFIDVHR